MKFIFDSKQSYPHKEGIFEFDSLEEFAEWTNRIECPRFVLVPPHGKNTWSLFENKSDYWLILTYPDYDQEK